MNGAVSRVHAAGGAAGPVLDTSALVSSLDRLQELCKVMLTRSGSARRRLEVLQDRCPPRPFADVQRTLVADLGGDALQLFKEFEAKAVAAASLAQVCTHSVPHSFKAEAFWPGLSVYSREE